MRTFSDWEEKVMASMPEAYFVHSPTVSIRRRLPRGYTLKGVCLEARRQWGISQSAADSLLFVKAIRNYDNDNQGG